MSQTSGEPTEKLGYREKIWKAKGGNGTRESRGTQAILNSLKETDSKERGDSDARRELRDEKNELESRTLKSQPDDLSITPYTPSMSSGPLDASYPSYEERSAREDEVYSIYRTSGYSKGPDWQWKIGSLLVKLIFCYTCLFTIYYVVLDLWWIYEGISYSRLSLYDKIKYNVYGTINMYVAECLALWSDVVANLNRYNPFHSPQGSILCSLSFFIIPRLMSYLLTLSSGLGIIYFWVMGKSVETRFRVNEEIVSYEFTEIVKMREGRTNFGLIEIIQRFFENNTGLTFRVLGCAYLPEMDECRPPSQKAARAHKSPSQLSLVEITSLTSRTTLLVCKEWTEDIIKRNVGRNQEVTTLSLESEARTQSAYIFHSCTQSSMYVDSAVYAEVVLKLIRLDLERARQTTNLNFLM